MPRRDGRADDESRSVTIERGFMRSSAGSVLYRCGATTVLVSAQLSDTIPPFLEGKGVGWLTAEYAMLPGSTPTRKSRGADGRSTEIQRLIGRGLRDRRYQGAWTLDDPSQRRCDRGRRRHAHRRDHRRVPRGVGRLARSLRRRGARSYFRDSVAAVSVGIVNGRPMLDLDYSEDSVAEVDFNVVRLGSGGLVEVQGTGEGGTFSRAQLTSLVDLAERGIDRLETVRRAVLEADFAIGSAG